MHHSYSLKMLLVCLLSGVCLHSAIGQCSIAGKVSDSAGVSLPYAAVGLMNAKDSSLVKGILSNDNGAYTFSQVKPGAYIIKVEVTGYAEYYSSPVKADSGKTTAVPLIHLKSKGNNLKGVKVVADKPFMQREADKTVYNIENSIIATGKNALELLNELPCVSANDNGDINVLGKGAPLVLVDGKPIHMDLATYLKSIDAGEIESIEVITNPSAKYEASGKAVINIVLKKNKNMGLNGELFSGCRLGFYTGYNESFNFDYRSGKWNFFGDFNQNIFNNRGTHNITRNFSDNGALQQVFTESATTEYKGQSLSGNAGFDYMPDKRQTISFSVDGFYQPETFKTNGHTFIMAPNSAIDSSLQEFTTHTYLASQTGSDLSYKFKIDSTGKELSADFQYGIYRLADTAENPLFYYNSNGIYSHLPTQFNVSQPNDVKFGSGQADYTQPLGKNAKLGAGVQAITVTLDNYSDFWNVGTGLPVIDSTKTNHFNMIETILAGYLTYSQKLGKKTDFQMGLRAEQTNDRGTQYVHDTSFTRNYYNLFPSASVNWNPSVNHSFSLSYTRRIDRPDYGDLNPFITEIDPYTYTRGNITLRPVLMDMYELDYYYHQFFGVSLGYYNMTNIFSNVYTQNDSTHVSYTMLENLNNYRSYNLSLTASLPITKWWTTSNYIFIYHDDYYGNYQTTYYNKTNLSVQLKTDNTFTFKHGWRVQLSFFYNSSNLNGVTLQLPINDMEAGISKRLFHDKLIVNVACSDVLRGSVETYTQVIQNVNISDSRYNDEQKFRIGLTWKFGKSQYHREETNKPATILKGVKG